MNPSGEAGDPGEARPVGAAKIAVLGVVALWLALLAIYCVQLVGLAADDMYITYRYAQNLALGRGLTFNPGERVFGISDPGVALLLAAGSRLTGVPIPVVGTLLTAAALLLLAGAVLWESRQRGRFWEAAAGGTLVVSSSFLWLGQGAGPLVALAGLALAALLAERRPAAAGVVAGLAFWCRPDALLGCGLLAGLLYLQKRKPPVAFLAGALAAGLLGVAAARLWFGRFIPSTLAAKRSFAGRNLEDFTGLAGFWGRARDAFLFTEGGWKGWGLAVVPLGALGLFLLWRHGGLAGRLAALYGVALALGYTVLRIPFSFWYVGPPAAVVFLGAGFAVGGAARFAARRLPGTMGRGVAAALVAAALLAVGGPLAQARIAWLAHGYDGDWRRAAYRVAGEWLARHAPPDGDVAYGEIGLLGFYGDRPIRDLIGLVTPSSIPYTAAGDQVGAFLVKPARYVLQHTADPRGGTRPIVSRPWFARAYRERVRLRLPKFDVAVILWERIPGSTVPPPRPPIDHRAAEHGQEKPQGLR
jgi:hypothetical protein